MSFSNLQESLLHNANLTDAILEEAAFEGCNCFRSHFTFSDLTRADFERAYLVEALFGDSNLTEANFMRANLSRAGFDGADLDKALLGGARIVDAYFSTARNLTQRQVNSASGAVGTKLPEGLKHPCWWRGVECGGKIGDGTPPEGWPNNLPED